MKHLCFAAGVLLSTLPVLSQTISVNQTNNQLSLNVTKPHSEIAVSVYDLTGRKVYSLPGQSFTEGTHTHDFSGSLASGVYVMQIAIDGKTYSSKFIPNTGFVFTHGLKSPEMKSLISSRSEGTGADTPFTPNSFLSTSGVVPEETTANVFGNGQYFQLLFDVALDNLPWSKENKTVVVEYKIGGNDWVEVPTEDLFGLRIDTKKTTSNTSLFWGNTNTPALNGGYEDRGEKNYRLMSGAINPKTLFNTPKLNETVLFKVSVTTNQNTKRVITGHADFNFDYESSYGDLGGLLTEGKLLSVFADLGAPYSDKTVGDLVDIKNYYFGRAGQTYSVDVDKDLFTEPELGEYKDRDLYSLAKHPEYMLHNPAAVIEAPANGLMGIDTETTLDIYMMGELKNTNTKINSKQVKVRTFYAPDLDNGNNRIYSSVTEQSLNTVVDGIADWTISNNVEYIGANGHLTTAHQTNDVRWPWYHWDEWHADKLQGREADRLRSNTTTIRELFSGIESHAEYDPSKGGLFIEIQYEDCLRYATPPVAMDLAPATNWFLIKVDDVDLTISDADYNKIIDEESEKGLLSFYNSTYWKFTAPQYQSKCDTSYVVSKTDPNDQDLTIDSHVWEGIKIKAAKPITRYDDGTGTLKKFSENTDLERVKMVLDVAFEGYKYNMADAGSYTGNIQVHINGSWLEQFELNTVLRMNDAGTETTYHIHDDIPGRDDVKLFYASYEVMLPKTIVDQFKAESVTDFMLNVNTKPDMNVTLQKLTFVDANSEDGRSAFNYLEEELNIDDFKHKQLLQSAIIWEDYCYERTHGSMSESEAFEAILVKDSTVSNEEYYYYYMLKQDVDYPLYLAHWWSRNPAYAPGGHVDENGVDWGAIYPGLWRQCWTMIGKEKKTSVDG